jgi:hypothetical protein
MPAPLLAGWGRLGWAWANCWRTKLVMKAEESAPHAGQTNWTGFCAMSGVMSNSYFAPHPHWIFIRLSG